MRLRVLWACLTVLAILATVLVELGDCGLAAFLVSLALVCGCWLRYCALVFEGNRNGR